MVTPPEPASTLLIVVVPVGLNPNPAAESIAPVPAIEAELPVTFSEDTVRLFAPMSSAPAPDTVTAPLIALFTPSSNLPSCTTVPPVCELTTFSNKVPAPSLVN